MVKFPVQPLKKKVTYKKNVALGKVRHLQEWLLHSLKKRPKPHLFVCMNIPMKKSRQKPSVKSAVQGAESVPSAAMTQQSFVYMRRVIWMDWKHSPRRTLIRPPPLRLLSLWDASVSPHTNTAQKVLQSQSGGELQPADSTADTPKAKQSTSTACPCCHVLAGSTD